MPRRNSRHAANKFSNEIISWNPPPTGSAIAVIQKVSDFYIIFHDFWKSFPKLERNSIGQKINAIILEILEKMLAAVYATQYKRRELLRQASEKIDLLKFLIRLAYGTKALPVKRYLLLQEKVIEIGKMLGGWLKSAL